MKTFATILGGVVIIVVGVTGLGLLFAFPTKWLINWLFAPGALTAVFGVSHISVWQAWGVNALGRLIFGAHSAGKKE